MGLGMWWAPALFVLGVFLLAPVGLGELLKPRLGLPVDTAGMALYLGIAVVFALLAAADLATMRVEGGR